MALQAASSAQTLFTSACSSARKDDISAVARSFGDAAENFSGAGYASEGAAAAQAKASLEAVLHTKLDGILSSEESDGEATIASLTELLDLCLALVMRDEGALIESKVPFALLEEAFDALTIDDCDRLWSVLEARRDTLTLPVFACSTGKSAKSKLLVLRIANSLLRRCSKTVHTGLSGKILLFLAYVCPLSERSGVNLSGAVNKDNATLVEDEAAAAASNGADEGDGEVVDPALYTSFWRLHQVMDAPKLIATREGARRDFEAALAPVLAAFEGNSLASSSSSGGGGGGGSSSSSSSSSSSAEQSSASVARKYLTKRSLLRLQLEDPQLRRQVLVQVLVVAGYAMHTSGSSGIGSTAAAGGASTPKVLKKDANLRRLRARAINLLRETPPDGARFVEYVERVTQREALWREWKTVPDATSKTRCADFSRVPQSADASSAKSRSGAPYSNGQPHERVAMWGAGASKLSTLYTLEAKEGDALKVVPDSAKLPEFEDYLQKYTDCDDPENEIEEKYHVKNNSLFCWRTMRLLCKGSEVRVFVFSFYRLFWE